MVRHYYFGQRTRKNQNETNLKAFPYWLAFIVLVAVCTLWGRGTGPHKSFPIVNPVYYNNYLPTKLWVQ